MSLAAVFKCDELASHLNFFLPSPFRQNLDKQINSFYIQCKQRIPTKKILPKKFSKKILKKFLIHSPPKNKKIQAIFQKIPKILKISNSLHCTQRPKTLSGLLLSAQLSWCLVFGFQSQAYPMKRTMVVDYAKQQFKSWNISRFF